MNLERLVLIIKRIPGWYSCIDNIYATLAHDSSCACGRLNSVSVKVSATCSGVVGPVLGNVFQLLLTASPCSEAAFSPPSAAAPLHVSTTAGFSL